MNSIVKKNATSRTVTFDGPAGTGKTTLIKNLVEKKWQKVTFSEPPNPEIVTATAKCLDVDLNSLIGALGREQAMVPIVMAALKGIMLSNYNKGVDDEELGSQIEVRDRGLLAQLLYPICNGVKCSVGSKEYGKFLDTHLLGEVNGKSLKKAVTLDNTKYVIIVYEHFDIMLKSLRTRGNADQDFSFEQLEASNDIFLRVGKWLSGENVKGLENVKPPSGTGTMMVYVVEHKRVNCELCLSRPLVNEETARGYQFFGTDNNTPIHSSLDCDMAVNQILT